MQTPGPSHNALIVKEELSTLVLSITILRTSVSLPSDCVTFVSLVVTETVGGAFLLVTNLTVSLNGPVIANGFVTLIELQLDDS